LAEVSFGEWLKRRRSALGLTQEQLALKLNCSTSALRKFESEERRPSAEVVEQLADIFNIPQEERKSFLRFARGDWQAISGGDTEDSPWHVSHIALRSNLPASTTSFIGREKEQAKIANLITKSRLVTLAGTGGIGKTRLSLETAYEMLNAFPDGIWFIELAPLSDPALIPQAIVTTLGLIEQANRPPQTVLTDFLQSKRALLILDNCEHLIQASAQLTETLLRACPNLSILATSREALGIAGETLYFIPPLSTPDTLHAALDTIHHYEAVQLFVERAQSTLADFELTQENAPAIAQICHHLDGIPLALELAAARLRGLSIEQVASRLNDRFHVLTSGARTVLPRHQTLQALIDWSHDLLTEPERLLLRRFSVFAGGWTLEAAEHVCAGDGLESKQILDLLLRLVDQSLVVAETQEAESRYHMLETIRQYAHEKLQAAGEGEITRQRHLAYFVDLAERAEPNLRAFDMVLWLDRLEAELDNIRVALEYALESDIEAELRLASALLWFWHIRGHRNEGIDWLERGLSIEITERGNQLLMPSRAMIRGKALNASGSIMAIFFDSREASARLEESLALFQELGSAGKRGMAYALLRLGALPFTRDLPAKSLLEQSLALFREVGDKFGAAECLMFLVSIAEKDEDNYKQAVTLAEEHLALRREIGDQDGIATALTNLGDLAFWQDDYERAIMWHEESLANFRKVGNKWATSERLSAFADIYLWQGDYERATKIYEEALAFAQELGDRYFIAINIYSLGTIAQFRGDYARATQMITDSLAVFRDVPFQLGIASSLHTLGDIALAQDDTKRAAQWYEAEMAFSQDIGLEMSLNFALDGLGKVAWAKGDYELATKRFEDGLKTGREVGFKTSICHALCGLGRVAQSRGDYAAARAFYAEALATKSQHISSFFKGVWMNTYKTAVVYPLAAFAVLATAQTKMEQGARLLGASECLYTPLRFVMSAKERAERDQAIAAAHAALGEEAFASSYEEGKKMTLDEVVAYALEDAEATVG